MTLPASLPDAPGADFVGEGPIPPELDGVNYGAMFFSIIWAWVFGMWRWFSLFLALLLVPVLLEQIPLLLLDPSTDLPRWQAVLGPVSSVAFWTCALLFGLRANRDLWEREHRRFEAAAGEPRRPIPLWRFNKSNRFWARLGFGLLVLSSLLEMGLVVFGRVSLIEGLLGMPSGLIAVAILFAVDRSRRNSLSARS